MIQEPRSSTSRGIKGKETETSSFNLLVLLATNMYTSTDAKSSFLSEEITAPPTRLEKDKRAPYGN